MAFDHKAIYHRADRKEGLRTAYRRHPGKYGLFVETPARYRSDRPAEFRMHTSADGVDALVQYRKVLKPYLLVYIAKSTREI